ncbi:MAG: hypothetical protein ACJAZI_000862 [Cycloclasticus sp.]|jgi:hypothetical protein
MLQRDTIKFDQFYLSFVLDSILLDFALLIPTRDRASSNS